VPLAGYQPVPDTLLMKQQDLGLDATDMLVLLNLMSYWWFRDRPPFPRTNVIAKRMGVSPRTVQRALHKLEASKLIRRADYQDDQGVILPAVYLDGLVKKLTDLAKNDATLSARMIERSMQGFPKESDEVIF
jgi:DNA-binding MarR family transcriptional regulator